MKSNSGLLQIALGVITGIGGFLEVGSIATSAEAGASFRYSLIWTVVLATVCLIFLVEMSGRLAAVSKHAIADAVRERFGFRFVVVPRVAETIVNILVLAAELGGVSMAVHLVTGYSIRAVAIPVAVAVWLAVWVGTLDIIEDGTSLLGLVAIAFAVAAVKSHPDWHELLRGLAPSVPRKDTAHYLFIAVSIAGATIAPYMFYFYSSGAIEEKWNEKSLAGNRITAALGMSFGGILSVAVLIAAAAVFEPRGISISRYEQVALVLTPFFGKWGLRFFAAALGVCCFGAAMEIALGNAYMTAQTLGWNWGEDKTPQKEARFSLTYTAAIFAGALIMVAGVDPLKLTMFSMALTAVILPFVIVPFIVLLNDEHYVKQHRNGPIGNAVVIFTIFLASIVAIVAIPLEIAGG
jgi:NRAMP (natural resistance-associated macrophage protein)-like metal ion transporter